jgi:hypothetical protein
MSKTTQLRARAMRSRPEVARLRSIGGLTERVVVDGQSLLGWCGRTGANFEDILRGLREAADAGRRDLVLVVHEQVAPALWPAPHVHVISTVGVAILLRDLAFGDVDLPALPSVIVAGVQKDPELLDALECGAASLLDIASGRLWSGTVRDGYDFDFAAARAPLIRIPEAAQLATAIQAPRSTRASAVAYVASAWHRQDDAVVLEDVLVDDGVRRRAVGHADALALLEQVLSGPTPAVVTSSMDVLDALADAGRRLPAFVEDPALACVVLDPDRRPAPLGLGGGWRQVLGRRGERGPKAGSLERLLDELPSVHGELRERIAQEGLTSLHEDVSRTIPVLAGLEREGFRVDAQGLAADLAHVQAEMDVARHVIVSGPRERELRNADLVRAPKEDIALLIQWSDGSLPQDWRTDPPMLGRYADFRNQRALAVQRLRALDAVYAWMKKIEGHVRLRSILEPAATGRWYPHGDALFTIPKHIPEAMLLRAHLVPEPGHVFVAGDYSAFEPRLLAHQSRDPALVAGCPPGQDIYTALMPLLKVTTRDIAKAALLGFIYGRTPASFAVELPLPLPEGHRIFHALAAELPAAMAFRDQVQKADTSMAHSLSGWRRVRGDGLPSEFARAAFNLRMQGSAADLFRKLLRDLASSRPAGVRLVHQEFDAVIVSCPASDATSVEAWLKQSMESVASLSVPLVAKTKHGATLADVS